MAALARQAAPLLELDPMQAYYAGLLHDIGKLWVSPAIVHAPGKLQPHQWSLMRAHPLHSARLVERWWPEIGEDVLHALRHHHERLDGQGYPDGLSELPPLTALIAAADVYDALQRHRSYRRRLNAAEAALLLRREALPEYVVSALLCTFPATVQFSKTA
ncbi:HD-GYP domain-containing protein [Deinococcus wulumuqiensis]|uniref:HD-GYP domain-containing protein n=1 Tax=Deinococcus wulumuqiensis TaxID=980427 RepID=UPI003B97345B